MHLCSEIRASPEEDRISDTLISDPYFFQGFSLALNDSIIGLAYPKHHLSRLTSAYSDALEMYVRVQRSRMLSKNGDQWLCKSSTRTD